MGARILSIDDHELVQLGLKSMLRFIDAKIVACASTVDDGVRIAGSEQVDLVLLDVRLGDSDGLSAISAIKKRCPDLPVLVYSAYDNPAFIARALAFGASGYVLKGASREHLFNAVLLAACGELTWSRDELRAVTGAVEPLQDQADLEVPLTKRERDVLRFIAAGLANKDISDVLGISIDTVKGHVGLLLEKIGVADRTQAAIWAIRKGLG